MTKFTIIFNKVNYAIVREDSVNEDNMVIEICMQGDFLCFATWEINDIAWIVAPDEKTTFDNLMEEINNNIDKLKTELWKRMQLN